MALTGLDIYKLLPKTNCKECGKPTCLAFAMALAQKKAELSQCPHVSEQAREALGAASAPPIRLVTIGEGDNKLEIGNETVLFRHEATFFHPTGLAVSLSDSLDPSAISSRIEAVKALRFDRVGRSVWVEMLFVRNDSGDAGRFAAAAKAAADSGLLVILASENPENIKAALGDSGAKKPLLYAATPSNASAMAEIARSSGCPLVAKAPPEKLVDLTAALNAAGVKDIVLDHEFRRLDECLWAQTQIRRLALRRTFRPLGYPVIAFATASDPAEAALQAAVLMAKYAAIVVLDVVEPWAYLPLLTWRLNVYTDPQKPIQVEPKIYEVGAANADSPVLVTTNFSLTYFTVEGEVEASRVPSYIVVVNTDGTSVLTAWAAEKFTADSIAKAVIASGVEGKVRKKKLIIPGGVAVLSGKLEEALPGWKICVGPREAVGIPSYLKNTWPSL
jgi:acetyl-CoA decarbonylase/synthase complex subunit gamma